MNVMNLLIFMALLAFVATIAGSQGGCPCDGKPADNREPAWEPNVTGFWQPKVAHIRIY